MAFSDDYGYIVTGRSVSVLQCVHEVACWHRKQQPVTYSEAEELREGYTSQLRDFYRHFFAEPGAHYEESLRVYDGLDLARNSCGRLYTTNNGGHVLEDVIRVCEDDAHQTITGLGRGDHVDDPISYFENAWASESGAIENLDIILVGMYKNICDSMVSERGHDPEESLYRARHYANMGIIYTLGENESAHNPWELKLELKGLKGPSAELGQAYDELLASPSDPIRFLYLYDVLTCSLTQMKR